MALCDPLVQRFPTLESIPRAELGVAQSPIEEWTLENGESLRVKRDDLNAPVMGGNKVRALQYLLAGAVSKGRPVITVGGVGSTHILATSVHARRLGIDCRAWRWPHEENATSRLVAARINRSCQSARVVTNPLAAFGIARWRTLRDQAHWVPFGGTSPRGMLGHIAAGLELARQLKDEGPSASAATSVFLPLGSGGTVVGLSLGLSAAEIDTRVVAVRCGPSLDLDHKWLGWLAQRALRFLRQNGVPGSELPRWTSPEIVHDVYAGAYGRPSADAQRLAEVVKKSSGLDLDATYSAKACYAAWRRIRDRTSAGSVIFWNTFDARWMSEVSGNQR